MAAFPHWTKSLAALSLLSTASTAAGQTSSTFAGTQPAIGGTVSVQANAPAYAAAAAPVARPSIAAAPASMIPPTKPFQMAYERPTISPYLQLHREGFEDTLPNYFAFVRPQIQQQEMFHQQQLEMQKIQQRLQRTGMQATAGHSGGAAGAPPQTFHSRFLNTGGYFSGVPLPQQQMGPNQ